MIVTSFGTLFSIYGVFREFNEGDPIYASVILVLLFAPLLFSLFVCAINWSHNPSHRWEFLWQVPGVQLIKHFQLWKKLKQTLNEKDNFSNVDVCDQMKNSNLDNVQLWEISDIEQHLQESLQSQYIY